MSTESLQQYKTWKHTTQMSGKHVVEGRQLERYIPSLCSIPSTVSGLAVGTGSVTCWPREAPAAIVADLFRSKREIHTESECTSVDFDSGSSNTWLKSFPTNLSKLITKVKFTVHKDKFCDWRKRQIPKEEKSAAYIVNLCHDYICIPCKENLHRTGKLCSKGRLRNASNSRQGLCCISMHFWGVLHKLTVTSENNSQKLKILKSTKQSTI
jgi:hypothetical protein